jgi:hypothetical protein
MIGYITNFIEGSSMLGYDVVKLTSTSLASAVNTCLTVFQSSYLTFLSHKQRFLSV